MHRNLILLALVCAANTTPSENVVAHDVAAVIAPMAVVAPTPSQIPGQIPAIRNVALPADSLIAINSIADLTSKTLKLGGKVKFATFGDVTQDGIVIIPKGTPGEGVVSFVKKPGAFGRPGKLEVTFTSLDLGGRMIMLTGKHRQDGAGNTGAAVGAILAAGVIGGLVVSGHSAVIKHDEALQARTTGAETFAQITDVPAPVTAPATPVSLIN